MLTRYLPIFIILALIAEILGTVGGFGSSVFFVPIANYFLDFQSVLGLTALFHLSSNMSKIAFFKKGFDKQLAMNLGIPAIIFVSIGAFLSKYVNPEILVFFLGGFLIVLSLIFLIYRALYIKPNRENAIIGGSLSGLIAGLLGTGGAIRGITMAAFKLSKEKFIATSAIIDLGIDLSRSIIYFFNGYIHRQHLYLLPILIVISIVGTYFGKLILNKMSTLQFSRFVLFLILIIGIATIVNELIKIKV
jgi:uncharacterized membrane protein YfcA